MVTAVVGPQFVYGRRQRAVLPTGHIFYGRTGTSVHYTPAIPPTSRKIEAKLPPTLSSVPAPPLAAALRVQPPTHRWHRPVQTIRRVRASLFDDGLGSRSAPNLVFARLAGGAVGIGP